MSYNILLWGFGPFNKSIIRNLNEKGHKIVGVIGNHNHGEDSGVVAGLDANGVLITSPENAEELIKSTKLDACILATKTKIDDIYSTLLVLGRNGVDTITTAEEAFFSSNTSPQKTKELDELFKKNNATLTASGMQDFFFGHIPVAIVRSSHRVEKLNSLYFYDIEYYGKAYCEAYGVGLNEKEFVELIDKINEPCWLWNVNEWICAKLGWKIEKTSQQIFPVLAEKDIYSSCLGRDIRVGEALGLKMIVNTPTENGVVVESTYIGQVFHGDMHGFCSWKITGEPNTELILNTPEDYATARACVIKRLSDLVNAPAGFEPTFTMELI